MKGVMIINCILIIACLCTGFWLGRLGSQKYYDGTISFGAGGKDFRLEMYRSDEQIARRGSMMLRVVEHDRKGGI